MTYLLVARMKRLAMIAVSIYVAGSSTPTVIGVPDDNYIDMIISKRSCAEDIGISTTPMVAPMVVSTGPFTLKSVSGDCYQMDYVNPNGTPSKSPMDWVRCP